MDTVMQLRASGPNEQKAVKESEKRLYDLDNMEIKNILFKMGKDIII